METDDAIHKDNASEASASMDNTSAAEFAAGRAGAPVAAACLQNSNETTNKPGSEATGSGSQVQENLNKTAVSSSSNIMYIDRVIRGRKFTFIVSLDEKNQILLPPSGPLPGSPHDRYAKIMFGDKQVMCDLMNNFIYPSLYDRNGRLTPSCFMKLDKELLSKDKSRVCDLLWSCASKPNAHEIIDVEFQSSIDQDICSRIHDYVDLINNNPYIISEAKEGGFHPFAFPILIYTGRSDWDGLYSLKFQSKFDLEQRMELFLSQQFMFLSPKHYEVNELLAMKNNLAALIFALYKPLDAFQTPQVLGMALDILEILPDHKCDVLTLFINYALRSSVPFIQFEVEELNPMPIETLHQAAWEAQNLWAKKFYEKALADARVKVYDEIRDEVRNEVRDEVRNEVRNEVRYEVRNEVRDEVRNEVRDEVRNEVRDEVRNEVRAEDRDEVMNLIERCRSENISDTETLQQISDMISSK